MANGRSSSEVVLISEFTEMVEAASKGCGRGLAMRRYNARDLYASCCGHDQTGRRMTFKDCPKEINIDRTAPRTLVPFRTSHRDHRGQEANEQRFVISARSRREIRVMGIGLTNSQHVSARRSQLDALLTSIITRSLHGSSKNRWRNIGLGLMGLRMGSSRCYTRSTREARAISAKIRKDLLAALDASSDRAVERVASAFSEKRAAKAIAVRSWGVNARDTTRWTLASKR